MPACVNKHGLEHPLLQFLTQNVAWESGEKSEMIVCNVWVAVSAMNFN